MRFSSVQSLGWAALAALGLASSTVAQPAPAAPVAPAASVAPAAPAANAPVAGSPEWIVDRFFVQKEFPDLARYSTGEFAELYKDSPTLGSIVPPSVTVSIRVLERTPANAIFGVSMTDGNVTKEWYAYLRNEAGSFKLEAIRTLTLNARFFEVMVAAERDAVGGKLTEAGLQELGRLHLIIASDTELKAHFLAQKALFEALEKEFAALTAIAAVSSNGDVSPAGSAKTEQILALAQQLRSLRLGALIRKFRDCEGCVILKVGGDGENQVGYLHAPAGTRVPAMSPGNFIFVEPIAPGWYIFKTV